MSPLDRWLCGQSDRCDTCGYHLNAQGCQCETSEWAIFTSALKRAARPNGTIHQTDVRPLIQRIPHKHRGTLYRKARTVGLIELVGKEPSTDAAGRNTDKDQKVYRLAGAA